MVRQLQQKNCNGRFSETKISNPDFIKLANAYNIPAINVRKREEINDALRLAFENNSVFIINFIIESMEMV